MYTTVRKTDILSDAVYSFELPGKETKPVRRKAWCRSKVVIDDRWRSASPLPPRISVKMVIEILEIFMPQTGQIKLYFAMLKDTHYGLGKLDLTCEQLALERREAIKQLEDRATGLTTTCRETHMAPRMDTNKQLLIESPDTGLYLSKITGRNRVTIVINTFSGKGTDHAYL